MTKCNKKKMTAYMKESPISARAVTLVQKNATEITGQKKNTLRITVEPNRTRTAVLGIP